MLAALLGCPLCRTLFSTEFRTCYGSAYLDHLILSKIQLQLETQGAHKQAHTYRKYLRECALMTDKRAHGCPLVTFIDPRILYFYRNVV